MKVLQIAFIAVFGILSLAVVTTSRTLDPPEEVSVQGANAPAPTRSYPNTRVIASSTAAVTWSRSSAVAIRAGANSSVLL